MPFKKNNPGCLCCGDNGIDVSGCFLCSGSDGRGPSQFQVVISNVVQFSPPQLCCNLSDVNGTFTLSYNASRCNWSYDNNTPGSWGCISTVTQVRTSMTIFGVNGVVSVQAFAGATLQAQIRWQLNTSPTNIDCFSLSSTSFPYLDNTSGCDPSSSSCLVTTL